MEDDEAEVAVQLELARPRAAAQRVVGELAHPEGYGRLFRRDLVPLQHRLVEDEDRPGPDGLRDVLVVGPHLSALVENGAAHSSSPRVKSMTQFVSHVSPPSSENACSHRGVGVVTPDHV